MEPIIGPCYERRRDGLTLCLADYEELELLEQRKFKLIPTPGVASSLAAGGGGSHTDGGGGRGRGVARASNVVNVDDDDDEEEDEDDDDEDEDEDDDDDEDDEDDDEDDLSDDEVKEVRPPRDARRQRPSEPIRGHQRPSKEVMLSRGARKGAQDAPRGVPAALGGIDGWIRRPHAPNTAPVDVPTRLPAPSGLVNPNGSRSAPPAGKAPVVPSSSSSDGVEDSQPSVRPSDSISSISRFFAPAARQQGASVPRPQGQHPVQETAPKRKGKQPAPARKKAHVVLDDDTDDDFAN
jgi:hypothetical protein